LAFVQLWFEKGRLNVEAINTETCEPAAAAAANRETAVMKSGTCRDSTDP
jgi:hypothetical protein